jgi:predicted transcriptional regulator
MKRGNPHNPIPETKKQQVRDLFKEGKKQYEIAVEVNLSRTAVNKILHETPVLFFDADQYRVEAWAI